VAENMNVNLMDRRSCLCWSTMRYATDAGDECTVLYIRR